MRVFLLLYRIMLYFAVSPWVILSSVYFRRTTSDFHVKWRDCMIFSANRKIIREKKLTSSIKTASWMGTLFRLTYQKCNSMNPTRKWSGFSVNMYIYKWYTMYSSHSFMFIRLRDCRWPFLCIAELEYTTTITQIREVSSKSKFPTMTGKILALFVGNLKWSGNLRRTMDNFICCAVL